jgi:hypothetical protein
LTGAYPLGPYGEKGECFFTVVGNLQFMFNVMLLERRRHE